MPANTDLILEAGNLGSRAQKNLKALAPKSNGMDTFKLLMDIDKNKASIASSEASQKTSEKRGAKIDIETIQLKKDAIMAHMQGAGENPETLARAKAAHLRDPVTKDIPIPPELEEWTPETPKIIDNMMMSTVSAAKQQELRLREEGMQNTAEHRRLTREGQQSRFEQKQVQAQSQFQQSETAKESRFGRTPRGPQGGQPKPSAFDLTMQQAGIDPGTEEYVRAARIKAGLEERGPAVVEGQETPKQPDIVQGRQDTKQARALDAFSIAIKNLDLGIQEHGMEVQPGEAKGKLGTQFSIVQANMRELFNTGVLQPGELPFFERALNNPTDWQSYLKSGGAEGIRGQLSELDNYLKTKRGQLTQAPTADAQVDRVAPPPSGGSVQNRTRTQEQSVDPQYQRLLELRARHNR